MANSNWIEVFNALDFIYKNYSTNIVKEPIKIKTLLMDLAPNSKKEVNVFSNVICEYEINRYISNATEIEMNYLVSIIECNMGLSTDWAKKIAIGILKLTGGKTHELSETKDISIDSKIVEMIEDTKSSQAILSTPKKYKTQKDQSYRKLIDNGYSRLSNGQWDKAVESFERVLSISPYPRAYIGKMMAMLRIKNENEIPKLTYDIESDTNWILAMKYSTGSYRDKLQRYAREHKNNMNNKRLYATTTLKATHAARQRSTMGKKDVSTLGMVMCIIGLLLLFVTVIFGVYAWFAQTGLSILSYYLIMVGASFLGVLLSMSDGGIKETIRCLCVFGFGIPVSVTIIGLIGEFIKWVIGLLHL